MKVTRYGNVLQLAFLPRLFPVNCYLVEEEDSLTLVDAALPFSVKAILRTAESLGKPITNIVLTHAHGDHIGAVDALKSQLPDVRLQISERDARLLAGDRSLDAGEPAQPIRGGVPKPSQIRSRPDRLLQDGDRVGSLLAVTTPGHTPGSMSFLDVRSGTAIVGDAFQVRGGIAVSGKLMPWFPFPAMATWSKETAIESARKLTSLAPSLLCAGHGRALERPEAVMKQAIIEAERALQSAAVRS
ncbi:MBL fold metallo-hydrolase [Gorillibacterium sp. sgz5001074]|uniref:MBL fold metallo-hydrolase n=1 Tax=Gorillibacterium sp. sgz5001074 TaxID=3446695 RepID=UPI003F67BE41